MKKYNFYLWLTVLVGLLASCSQDEAAGPQTNTESNRVTFTASLPADFAQPGTRAALPSQTGYQLRFILEVWDETYTNLKVRQEVCAKPTDQFMKFTFELQDIGNYQALLWADYIDANTQSSPATIAGLSNVAHYPDKYYTTDAAAGLKAVSLKTDVYTYTTAKDAFCLHLSFEKKATALNNLNGTLIRPFTLLSIGERNIDNWNICETVKATYTIPTTINVSTGELSGTHTAVYNDKPEGKDMLVKDFDVKTFFSDYIFAPMNGGTMGDIVMEFTPTSSNKDKEFGKVTIPAGIPLKANFRVRAGGYLAIVQDVPSPSVQMLVDVADWVDTQTEEVAPTVWDGTYPTSEAEALAWMGRETSGANDPTAANHVFTIKAARQLAALHYLMVNDVKLNGAVGTPDGAEKTIGDGYGDATYNLVADIDLNNKPWTPIGGVQGGNVVFTGTLDGQGHTVSGMNAVKGTYLPRVAFISGFEGTLKHLNVKGVLNVKQDASPGACGGIVGFHSGGTIAFCSFQGTITAAGTKEDSSIGGISGYFSFMRGNAQIISCYSVLSSVEVGPNVTRKGGIAGYMADSGTIKGCYWQTLSGLDGTNPYGEKDVDIIETIKDCGTFTNAAGANDNTVINAMNQYDTDYDYHWQAATDGGYPVLVKKP